MKFLSPDSGFMRGLSDAVDAIWINILMLVTSIPIITIGAALTAGHDAVRRGHGDAQLFQGVPFEFCEIDRLLADFRHDRHAVRLLVDRAADHAAAHSEIRVDDCVAHRFRMGVGVAGAVRELVLAHAWQRFCVRREQHRPHVGMVAIDAVYVALLVASWVYMPQGLFLLLILGYGTMLMLHSPILEHVFRKYISK